MTRNSLVRLRSKRRALISRRHRAWVTENPPVKKKRRGWTDEGRTNATIGQMNRLNRERQDRGLEPIDHTLDHAGNPDHEIEQLPDSLLRDE